MKHTLVNSVSLIAVTAMLAGCGESKNSDKSKEQVLQEEVIRQGNAFELAAQSALNQEKESGVLLPVVLKVH